MGKRRVSMLSISRIFGMNTEPGVIVTKSPGIDERLIVIRRTAFILYIPDDLLRDFAACFMTMIKVKAGEEVPVFDGNIYIVVDGEIELNTTIPSQENLKVESAQGYLCKKRSGDILTALQTKKDINEKMSSSKLGYFVDSVRLTAIQDLVLLAADNPSVEKFLENKQKLRLSLQAITENRIKDYLAKISMLQSIRETQYDVLAAMCRYEAVQKDTVIFSEGDPGRKLYIIVAGSVSVNSKLSVPVASGGSKDQVPKNNDLTIRTNKPFELSLTKTKNGELFGIDHSEKKLKDKITAFNRHDNGICLALLGDGDYFGETALMVDIPRTTSVTATQKTLLLTVERNDWNNFLKVCPNVRNDITQVMKDRMIEKLTSLDIPFFQGIPTESFTKISKSIEIRQFQLDDILFCEGDIGHHFYIVIHGAVQIIGGTGNLGMSAMKYADSLEMTDVGLLGPGMYFGEMALVSDVPRSATVISKGKTVLLAMGKKSFHHLFDSNKTAAAEFQLKLFRGAAELCHVLEHPRGLFSFRIYLEKEMASENVKFWEEAKVFRVTEFTDEKEKLSRANKIFNEYCDVNAENQVNLPASIRDYLSSKLSENFIHSSIFDQAVQEIYRLMVRDNFARYKSSGQLETFLRSLGIFI
uniref:Cyclic nucleotide-binding domain-containing protein n=1 Tax=Corethron hystrix TaxID=216773 RepID=A0A7S1BBP2_9STRA|mmetsp:Transcript_2063/g.4132  ORF Transcript_2063/g.4132 Transcript_2063/m.4132 type:complete len:641 (+) Transcript_2063:421-2343(+)